MWKLWIEHKLKIIVVDLLRPVMLRLPRRLFYALAAVSAVLTYSLSGEKVKVMRRELTGLLGGDLPPGKGIEDIIRQGIVNIRKDLFETWMFPSLTREKTKRLAYLEGKENLDEALKRGRGAILLLAHFGFRKLVLPALGFEGYAVNQLAAKPTSWDIPGRYGRAHKKIMDVEYACEKAIPAKFIYTDQNLRPVFRALSNNESVVIAIDGVVGQKRVAAPLLNYTAHLSPTPIHLALRTGARVLPVFIVRQRDTRHKIVIEQPLVLQEDGQNEEAAIADGVRQFCAILERYVREYPCHYADYLYRARLWPIAPGLFVFQKRGENAPRNT